MRGLGVLAASTEHAACIGSRTIESSQPPRGSPFHAWRCRGRWLTRVVRPSKLACHLASWYSGRVPKVFEKDGFLFFFYSNEHRPIHVHVRRGGGEAVFEVESGVELRESQGFKVRDLARAEALALEHRDLIIRKWHEHLDR